ncbi:unnamed protein product [Polarella glacialis]|uniref:Bestrophin homolog n=1 Tax=Polarella glacialis TaxID=89957 RepID=A0A813G0A3_POLGL|nr:unnamed protein product [Polarella glacialis]
MINYEEDWLFSLLCGLKGSVYLRSFTYAIPSALLSFLFLMLDTWNPGSLKGMGLDALTASQCWSGSSAILVFLLGFRARQGLARFWEGTGLLHQMRGEWFDTVSNCVTFTISAKQSKPEQVMNFRHALVRLMSLAHARALEEISGNSVELHVIDIMGLDVATLTHIKDCTEIHKFNKVEVCVHMVQSLIIVARDEGILKVPPPILSRVFQTISRGFVNLLNTKKITDTKFPYPFAQTITFFLLVHSLLTPLVLAAVIPNNWMCTIVTFVTVTGLFALDFISVELENPFGTDANDLPLTHFQEEMNSCLLMLLHPKADLIISPNCQRDFQSWMSSMDPDPEHPHEKKPRGQSIYSKHLDTHAEAANLEADGKFVARMPSKSVRLAFQQVLPGCLPVVPEVPPPCCCCRCGCPCCRCCCCCFWWLLLFLVVVFVGPLQHRSPQCQSISSRCSRRTC